METLKSTGSPDSEISKTGNKKTSLKSPLKPTPAFVGASWMALFTGTIAYCTGLWNATMELNEKGYYFTILLFGLFAVVSVQKTVRDKAEGLEVTDLYYGLAWFATIASVVLLIVGLWNADLLLSEKGFYGISFMLTLFAAIAVQKNTRDLKLMNDQELKS